MRLLKLLAFFRASRSAPWSTLREKHTYSKFVWSVYSRIRIEYGEMLNTEKNSEYGNFSPSVKQDWKISPKDLYIKFPQILITQILIMSSPPALFEFSACNFYNAS